MSHVYLKADEAKPAYDIPDLLFFMSGSVAPNHIFFHLKGKEIIRLEENGDIYVHGRLVENDKDVVQGMRDLILGSRSPTW